MALRNISGSSGHVQVMNLWKKNNKKKRDREERSPQYSLFLVLTLPDEALCPVGTVFYQQYM